MKGIKTVVSTAYPSGTISSDVTQKLKDAFPTLDFDVMDRRRLCYDFGFTIENTFDVLDNGMQNCSSSELPLVASVHTTRRPCCGEYSG